MIVKEEIDLKKIAEECKNPVCGCEVIFLGFVRGMHENDLSHELEIECYEEMAGKKIEEIEKDVMNKFEVRKCKIVHRMGKLKTGDDIVCIAVSAPHRAEAFDACRYAIEELKRIVPIWKRE